MNKIIISLILSSILLLFAGCNGDKKAKYPQEKIKDIPLIILPSDFLKGNYIGLIQCKTLYEMLSFTAYRRLNEVDNKYNSYEFIESEDFKKNCDLHEDLTIRCEYIEKFKEKSNEIAISQDLSRENFWNQKDLAEFYADKMMEFAMIANAEEESDKERLAKLQISDDLSTCMDYRDYVDGNLAVGIDLENQEQLEEISKKDLNELSLNDQAMMYLLGRGVKQDFKEAVRLFSIMAEEGNEYAQANLGLMYSDGKGVKKDYEKALYWFKKAAEQGNAGATVSLGFLYAKGHGVDKNPEEAMRLYRLSAEQGNWMAQRNLGYLYKDGADVPIDLVKSFMWFLLASSSGDKVSESEIKELRNMINDTQESQGLKMAEKCISSEYLNCGYS